MMDALFAGHRVAVILRGRTPAETVTAAERAWNIGVRVVEVPIGTAKQIDALAATIAAGATRGLAVGAGTVLTRSQVKTVADIGARYTVAPGFDPDVLAASRDAGLPHLPGVATPSEVHRVATAGCTWVKVFPAGILGPAWFRAMRGPFPQVRYLATGGVDLTEADDYLSAGADIVAFGPAATDADQLDQLAELVQRHD